MSKNLEPISEEEAKRAANYWQSELNTVLGGYVLGELPWIQEMATFKFQMKSKFISSSGKSPEENRRMRTPHTPLGEILIRIKEALNRPEVLDAFRKRFEGKDIESTPKPNVDYQNILHAYFEYLSHKYSNRNNATRYAYSTVDNIANGKLSFTSWDDPTLKAYLLENKYVYDDLREPDL